MEQLRFNQEITAFLAQERIQLAKKRQLVRHFVNHVEGKNEINWFGNIEIRLVAPYESNPGAKICSFDLGSKFVEHSLLKISCDDPAAKTN